MTFFDHAAPHRPLGPDVEFERGHAPAFHVRDKLRHRGRIGERVADVAMKGRIAVDQWAGQKHARRRVGMRFRKARNEFFGGNLIASRSHRRHAGLQKERQDFIAGNMREVQNVNQMNMGVDQSGD